MDVGVKVDRERMDTWSGFDCLSLTHNLGRLLCGRGFQLNSIVPCVASDLDRLRFELLDLAQHSAVLCCADDFARKFTVLDLQHVICLTS